jgi:hypothetical protein
VKQWTLRYAHLLGEEVHDVVELGVDTERRYGVVLRPLKAHDLLRWYGWYGWYGEGMGEASE